MCNKKSIIKNRVITKLLILPSPSPHIYTGEGAAVQAFMYSTRGTELLVIWQH